MEDETALYSTIPYTPGWYYNKFPGFWNVECYKVLSDFSNNPEKYQQQESDEQSVSMTECDNENKNSKRKHSDIDCDLKI
jgi:hypothetical protein